MLLLSFRKHPEKFQSLDALEHQSIPNLASGDFKRGASPEHSAKQSNIQLPFWATVRGESRADRAVSSLS